MGKCFDPDCSHRSERDTCVFFRFPKSPGVRRKWLRALNRPDGKEPMVSGSLCSCHFPQANKRLTPKFKRPRSSPGAKKRFSTKRRLNAEDNIDAADRPENPQSRQSSPWKVCTIDKPSEDDARLLLSLHETDESAEPTTSNSYSILKKENAELRETNKVLSDKCTKQDLLSKLEEIKKVLTEDSSKTEKVLMDKMKSLVELNENLMLDLRNTKEQLYDSRQQLHEMCRVSATLNIEKQGLAQLNSNIQNRLLFENVCTDDNVAHFTGLPNINTFYWLLSMIPDKINYRYTSNVNAISRSNQLFMTLPKLRRNVSHVLLSVWFKVSRKVVSNVIQTWVSVLHTVLVIGMMSTVPSLEKTKLSMPEAFNKYPNCRMIIDCTEVTVQVPNSMNHHNLVYSGYKHRTTFKGLVGCAPNGTVTFISELYPGSTSDKVVVEKCGVLSIFKAGDAVMADKGFLIKDMLPPGVELNLPPFKETPQFTQGQVFETLSIARSRIHVERAIQRVKLFHILDLIPATMFQYASNTFQVCGALCNFMRPLIKEVEESMR